MGKHLEWRRMDGYWELMLVNNIGVIEDNYLAAIKFGKPSTARFRLPTPNSYTECFAYKNITEAKTDIINVLTDIWCDD